MGPPELHSLFYLSENTAEVGCLQPQKRPSAEPNHADTVVLDFYSPHIKVSAP